MYIFISPSLPSFLPSFPLTQFPTPSAKMSNLPSDDAVPPMFTIEKEPMFEKPLTPSDVGKLNRLVIPKQYAERYFPIQQGTESTLLTFDDVAAEKCWNFRYSYWNSSQSYVLTKGWSRFVKEKRLEAGDVVSFERGRNDRDRERMFIGWRKRGGGGGGGDGGYNYSQWAGGGGLGAAAPPYADDGGGGGGGGMMGNVPYQQPEWLHSQSPPPDVGGVTAGSTSGNSKTLRLFGVNMEWQPENEDDQPSSSAAANYNNCSSSSSSGPNYPME